MGVELTENSHFCFSKMAMIRTSALRFAMRTTAVRQNPFDLNRTGEFHKKYEAEHGEKFKYAYVDCGPSMAPWMNLPTESKPNPFGDHTTPHHTTPHNTTQHNTTQQTKPPQTKPH